MKEPKTHQEVIKALGATELAKYMNQLPNTVIQWGARNNIPARHWVKVAYFARKKGIKVTIVGLEKMSEKK